MAAYPQLVGDQQERPASVHAEMTILGAMLVEPLAITDATAKEIGIAMGKAPAYAEKTGPWLIDAALDALIAADEMAGGSFEQENEKIAA